MRESLESKVVRMFQHIDSSEWSRLDDYFHPQIEYRRPGYQPIKGLDELHTFYELTRIVKNGHHTINSILYDPAPPALCVTGSFEGVDKIGRNLSVRFCDVYEFREEKIIRRETFFSAPVV
jgi:ketosteroid isomerase-like protein